MLPRYCKTREYLSRSCDQNLTWTVAVKILGVQKKQSKQKDIDFTNEDSLNVKLLEMIQNSNTDGMMRMIQSSYQKNTALINTKNKLQKEQLQLNKNYIKTKNALDTLRNEYEQLKSQVKDQKILYDKTRNKIMIPKGLFVIDEKKLN